MYAFVRNEIVPLSAATLHISDLSVQRGFGVFDFFRVTGKTPLFLHDYLDRFYRSAERMQLTVPMERQDLILTINALISKNGLDESGMKILLTGGYSPDGYKPGQPNLIINQQPLVLPPQEQVEKGIKVILHNYVRELPDVKSINYSTGILLIRSIQEQGAHDVLYHRDGIVSEFPRCNFFIVRSDGVLITPDENILHGVTRKNVITLAQKEIEVQEGLVTVSDALHAREAFLTSTTKRVLPVTMIDGHTIGTGKPGPVTMRLLTKLKELERAGFQEVVR